MKSIVLSLVNSESDVILLESQKKMLHDYFEYKHDIGTLYINTKKF